MPTLDDLPPRHLHAVAELTARLKHDLGKYVSFGARWLPEDADLAARTQALGDDLLRTRRGPHGVQDAPGVWEPYRQSLVGERPVRASEPDVVDLSEDADVMRVLSGMRALSALAARLHAGAALRDDEVDGGLATCREVSAACRDLHRRAHEASRDHG